MGGGVLAGSLIRSVHDKDWGALAELVDGDASSITGSDTAGRCLLHYVVWKSAPPSLLHRRCRPPVPLCSQHSRAVFAKLRRKNTKRYEKYK